MSQIEPIARAADVLRRLIETTQDPVRLAKHLVHFAHVAEVGLGDPKVAVASYRKALWEAWRACSEARRERQRSPSQGEREPAEDEDDATPVRIHVLVYNAAFRLDGHHLALKYNERWVEELRRSDFARFAPGGGERQEAQQAIEVCPAQAISVNPGVGCAAAILNGWISGSKPSCGCGG